MVSRRIFGTFRSRLGFEKFWEDLDRSWSRSHLVQKSECLGLVSISDFSVSCYQLISTLEVAYMPFKQFWGSSAIDQLAKFMYLKF